MEFSLEHQEFFIQQNVEIRLFPDSTIKKFSTLKSFYDYMQMEREFWKTCNSGQLARINTHFSNIITQLDTGLITYKDRADQWPNNLKNAINSAKNPGFPNIHSSTPTAKFVKERFMENLTQGEAACNYLLENKINVNSLGNTEYVKGILSSYVYRDNDTQGSENEKQTLLDLRQRFTAEIDDLHGDYLKRSQVLDEEHTTFQGNIKEWKDTTQDDLSKFIEEKRARMIDLERIYQEKLRLEGPATYWKGMADDYTAKGDQWRKWTIVSTISFICYLTILLYNLPASWANSFEITLSNVKSTIIFALIASMGVYLINLFVKLSTSSYHLARDANERCQLTYVYLSLLNEKAVAENERSIVLQSIFSRADTGLLKGDSSPTIPDSNLLSSVLKNLKT